MWICAGDYAVAISEAHLAEVGAASLRVTSHLTEQVWWRHGGCAEDGVQRHQVPVLDFDQCHRSVSSQQSLKPSFPPSDPLMCYIICCVLSVAYRLMSDKIKNMTYLTPLVRRIWFWQPTVIKKVCSRASKQTFVGFSVIMACLFYLRISINVSLTGGICPALFLFFVFSNIEKVFSIILVNACLWTACNNVLTFGCICVCLSVSKISLEPTNQH